MSKSNMSAGLKKAFAAAKKARQKAHAPYSHFHVGAVIVTKKNKLYSGHNIENASFGATVCAERTAIWNWHINAGGDPIKELLLITEPLATPCGMCLQVMSEFFSPVTLIHLATNRGIIRSVPFGQLLPQRFDPSALKK